MSIPFGRTELEGFSITHKPCQVYTYSAEFFVSGLRSAHWFSYNRRPRWYHRFLMSWAEEFVRKHGDMTWCASQEEAFAAAVRFAQRGGQRSPEGSGLADAVAVESQLQDLTTP